MHGEYKETMISEFRIEGFSGQVLYWNYVYEDYSGDAQGYFVDKGKLYYVNGSHCSCFGLEDQFEPEEVTIAELRAQNEKFSSGSYYQSEYREGVRAVLDYFDRNGEDLEMIEMLLILSQ